MTRFLFVILLLTAIVVPAQGQDKMKDLGGRVLQNEVHVSENTKPALIFFKDRLYMVWIAPDLRIHVMSSANGFDFENRVTLNDSSRQSPALATDGNKLFLAWTGVGNRNLNVMQSSNGTNFENKVTLGDDSDAAPGLAFR